MAPTPRKRYRDKVSAEMAPAYSEAASMTTEMVDAIVDHVWAQSRETETVFNGRLDSFVRGQATFWDSPNLRGR